jgi:nucleotide-binding universal stress UspA family protein
VRTLLSHAAPTQALIDVSSGAALLVLGSDGPAGLADSILGTPSHRVATRAHCPVAVVPADPRSQSAATGRVVVGLSPTRTGRLAMHYALDEAGVRGCAVTAVCGGGGGVTGDVDRLKARVAETYPGVVFDVVLADDEPARAVLDSARGAELIVLGCHHSDDMWSARLGSVPTAVLHRAACPVLVVGQLH